MQRHNWRYEGEGGRHVVFSFHPSDDEDCSNIDFAQILAGSLVRLDKRKLILAASYHNKSDEKITPKLRFLEKGNDCQFFAREVVRPRLSPFVDLPLIAVVNTAFALELRDIALQSAPEARRQDWNSGDECAAPETPRNLMGQISRDYRLWHLPDGSVSNRGTVCFEIKPKAGYLSVSPLVDPRRRIKYQVSRFRIFQRLSEQKGYCKSWVRQTELSSFEPSLYDPLDLFSGERERISQAVSHLILSPQNNLVVWKGRKVVLGLAGSSHDSVDWKGLLTSLGVDAEKLDQPSARDQVVNLVNAVLEVELCLKSILDLQKLDVLDGDGAVLVYQRLVDLCHGSVEKAEGLVNRDPLHLNKESSCDFLMGASPIELPPEARQEILAYCDRVKAFSNLIEAARPELPLAELMDNAHVEAVGVASAFSPQACIYFLQNWLLSLSMCDVSLFVTFQCTEDRSCVSHYPCECAVRPHVARLQQDNVPGLIKVPLTGNSTPTCLVYRVKVIDYDRKPAEKLRTRVRKEVCINTVDFECLQDVA